MNAIQVQCGKCKRRFAAKPHLAGKRVKCPRCKDILSIPDPDVVVATAVEDTGDVFSSSDVFESPGDSIFDDVATHSSGTFGTSAPAGASHSGSPFAATSSPSFGSAASPSASELISQFGPSVGIAIVSIVALVVCFTFGHRVAGMALLMTGIAVASLGLVFVPQKRRKKASSATRAALGGAVFVYCATLLIISALLRMGRVAIFEDFALLWYGVLGILGLGLLASVLIFFFVLLGRFGFVRAASILYITAAVSVPVFLVVSVPEGGVRGRRLAGTEPPRVLTKEELPGLGAPRRGFAAGVDFYEVRLPVKKNTPGYASKLYVYLPKGSHAEKSLPCVFIAGAGAIPFAGMELGSGDQPEHIPYAQAGFAVVAYEIDGYVPDAESASESELLLAFEDYRACQAGLTNARNAILFALTRVPAVDPERLYTAGHSSAATQAVLLAEKDSRIQGCIAYAGIFDLEDRVREALSTYRGWIDDFDKLLAMSSPKRNEDSLRCPVLLFHAADDQVVPISESINLDRRLRLAGRDVKLVRVPSGGHYDSMISKGIPQGIAWLKEQAGMPPPGALASTAQPENELAGSRSPLSSSPFAPDDNPFAEPDASTTPSTPVESSATGESTPGDSMAESERSEESPFSESPFSESPFSESPFSESPFSESPFSESPFSESPPSESPFGDASSVESPPSESPFGDASAKAGGIVKPGLGASPFGGKDDGENPFAGGSSVSDNAPAMKTASEPELRRLIDRMSSTSGFDQRKAFEEIARIEPDSVESDELRSEIVSRLNDAAIAADFVSRDAAIKALGTWGDSSSVSILIGLLADRGNHGPVFKALARIKDPTGAMAVAERLGNFFDKDEAEACLRQMGPAAEDALIVIAPSTNKEACLRVLRILGDVGTEKSYEVLREAIGSRDLQIREAGKLAMRKVRYRLKAKQEDGGDGEK